LSAIGQCCIAPGGAASVSWSLTARSTLIKPFEKPYDAVRSLGEMKHLRRMSDTILEEFGLSRTDAMARRKRVADAIQAEVLVKSRRRCCVCYGLKRDADIKQGQIAHLDQDPANNNESNLAFLCFDHHDQFDSKTSQSKNLTAISTPI
jgi:hypothetical protein